MSKKPTPRKPRKPVEAPAAPLTLADYCESRNVSRDDAAAAVETLLEGHSTHPASELTAAEQSALDEFFQKGQTAKTTPVDQDEQPGMADGLDHQQERHPQTAPPVGDPVALPAGVKPYGPRLDGQHCWLVEFFGNNPAVAYAWGYDESEAISRSLAALKRAAGKSQYRVRRCDVPAV